MEWIGSKLLSGVSGSNRRQGELGCKYDESPRTKERKEKGRAEKKGIEVKADSLSLDRIERGHEHGSILWLRLLFHQRGRNYDLYCGVGVEAVVLIGD